MSSPDMAEVRCERCGAVMQVPSDTEWQLHEIYSVSHKCQNCLHVQKGECIVLKKERWQ